MTNDLGGYNSFMNLCNVRSEKDLEEFCKRKHGECINCELDIRKKSSLKHKIMKDLGIRLDCGSSNSLIAEWLVKHFRKQKLAKLLRKDR